VTHRRNGRHVRERRRRLIDEKSGADLLDLAFARAA
jgi:hypothetical protein